MRRDLVGLVGADGYLTLVLSNLVIVATGGISWLWEIRRVISVARRASTSPSAEVAVVLGFRLNEDRVSREFATRLERARALYAGGMVHRILIAGGNTGRGRVSEAEAGRHYLTARHVPDDVISSEVYSRHTLENLRHVRASLQNHPDRRFLLITSRYHLARCRDLAKGLGLKPILCPAEDRLGGDLTTVLRICLEAWFLHWYVVGRAWAQWTGTRRSLARIS